MAEPIGTGIALLSDRRRVSRGRLELLERRLEDGYARIEQANAEGADIRAWEEFWIVLLREYEAICDELALAA